MIERRSPDYRCQISDLAFSDDAIPLFALFMGVAMESFPISGVDYLFDFPRSFVLEVRLAALRVPK